MADREEREISTADIAGAARRSEPASAGPGTAVLDAPEKGDERTPLFSPEDAARLHERWTQIQTGFVDEPREAVRRADTLVAEAIQRLAETFAREKTGLEEQWSRGGEVSTEDLRQALRRYRSFFERLLSV